MNLLPPCYFCGKENDSSVFNSNPLFCGECTTQFAAIGDPNVKDLIWKLHFRIRDLEERKSWWQKLLG